MDYQNVKILYEDDCCVVFNKPAGLLVIPTPKNEKETLINTVNTNRTSERLHPCHRLDRQTSGVILFAKGKQNQKLFMQLFNRHLVEKKYIAFVKGKLKNKNGLLKSVIRDFYQKKFNRHSPARLAITQYRVIQQQRLFSVVEVRPKTGRTNQIRIQFSEIGHPLLGERIYAFRKDFQVNFRRLALHACEISFLHPKMNKRIMVTAELPKDMSDFLKKY